MIPSQNASGINGASVVSVPESTGRKTSPAASFAAFIIPIPWFSKRYGVYFLLQQSHHLQQFQVQVEMRKVQSCSLTIPWH